MADRIRGQRVVGMLVTDVAFETFEGSEKFATLVITSVGVQVTLHRPEVVALRDYMTEWLERGASA